MFPSLRASRPDIGAALEEQAGSASRGTLRWKKVLVATLGTAAGLPLAFALTRYLRSELYGLSHHDLRTITGAVALLGMVAFLAGYLPERRASRVDPLVALRYA